MKNITKTDFNEAVKDGVVLIDFYANWCGPCKMIAPILTELSTTMADEATILKVNVDEEGELAQRFDVMSIPTLILFKDGKPVGRKTGFLPKPELEKFIRSAQ
ncbi:thioredoxin [Erysipelothrix rhusiopathiae]|uniref:Thioredoxin n=2 Tax=Erysipelothrix TaxID=1647 RepID=E7FWP1_ERYRH|nr:thioredoxin [Erysipelothrix rhusiopathiae]UPU38648.1 thioredoxin [Erysipelothrix sp. Poltava]CAH2760446.1 thioredoxin [Erysipelothrix sp. A18Y020d]AGN24789.1 thioredoxin [Erysipelothrix rhusiopathiae SY1027]AMS10470.1 thiol reductase thioredoxin [Erysipelothrix rhusiopathiae]AOO67188.1 thioredoxin [Erysipelothrix rhusiopathiae]